MGVDLDRYLNRLGVAPPLEPTVETLRRLHVAHLGAFLFHNLTIQRGGTVDVALDAVARRFLEESRGGYCFEQNTLFAGALRQLGFDVAILLARVSSASDRALTHMLLRVDVEGEPWLADVGFGGDGLLEPMPLREKAEVTQCGVSYALRRDEYHWTLTMRRGGAVDDLYEFSGAPHTEGDVEMANYYTATHPSSIFRKTLTIQRVTPEERVILRPRMVSRSRGGIRVDTPIEPSQLRPLARELFGIELEEAPLLFEQQQGGR